MVGVKNKDRERQTQHVFTEDFEVFWEWKVKNGLAKASFTFTQKVNFRRNSGHVSPWHLY